MVLAFAITTTQRQTNRMIASLMGDVPTIDGRWRTSTIDRPVPSCHQRMKPRTKQSVLDKGAVSVFSRGPFPFYEKLNYKDDNGEEA